MREDKIATNHFTPEVIDQLAHLWTHLAVSVVDVRYNSVAANQPLQDYRMPVSMLIYAYGAAASVQLDARVLRMERFGLFHGGKGTTVSIYPDDDQVHAYLVFYKAERVPFYRRELQRMQEQINPFMQQFGYTPENPVWLVDIFQRMFKSWQRANPLGRLHTKNLLYQAIHEIYGDLGQKKASYLSPDPVVTARRYLDEHYMEPLLFQEIADMFGISGGQLTRLFKKREGVSMQVYLILKRLEAARRYLAESGFTVREIAVRCGLADELNLIRMFKRHYDMTPSEYRKIAIAGMPSIDIDNNSHHVYNEGGLPSAVESQRDGAFTMFGQTKSKEMILAAAMSVMLLLSACASATPASNSGTSGNTSNPPAAATQQVQQTEGGTVQNEAVAQTRTVTTVMGEVEVPLQPSRVVCNWFYGELFSLDVQPVALGSLIPVNENVHFFDQVQGVSGIEWDAETIMTHDPDLIITFSEEDYEELSKIAPVIVIPHGLAPVERMALLGEVFGKEQEAQDLVNTFESKVDSLKQQIQEQGLDTQTVSVFQDWNDYGLYAEASKRGASLLYSYLGLAMPENLSLLLSEGNDRSALSYEVVPSYTGDYVVYVNHGSNFQESEIWKNVEAVKNNQVLYMDEADMSMTLFDDVESMIGQLHYFQTQLFGLDNQ